MVTDAIKEIIEAEGLQPGDKLYSEHQLTEKLEVSRSSIRESIRILEVTGVVRVHQGKGVFICNPPKQPPAITSWVVDNTDLLMEHFEVRLLIEPHAAAEAARKADDKDISDLKNVYQEFINHLMDQQMEQVISCDSEFHMIVARATKNRTLSVLMKTMAQTLNEGWIASLHTPGRMERTVDEHGEILQAIIGHDGATASRLMREHLLKALTSIEGYTKRSLGIET